MTDNASLMTVETCMLSLYAIVVHVFALTVLCKHCVHFLNSILSITNIIVLNFSNCATKCKSVSSKKASVQKSDYSKVWNQSGIIVRQTSNPKP